MALNKPGPGRLERCWLPSASAGLLPALLLRLWLPAAAMAAAAALVMAVWRPTSRSESVFRKASRACKRKDGQQTRQKHVSHTRCEQPVMAAHREAHTTRGRRQTDNVNSQTPTVSSVPSTV